jgi:hypothetical protein
VNKEQLTHAIYQCGDLQDTGLLPVLVAQIHLKQAEAALLGQNGPVEMSWLNAALSEYVGRARDFCSAMRTLVPVLAPIRPKWPVARAMVALDQELCAIFLANGADPNAVHVFDGWERTPLHWAIKVANIDYLRMFLAAGAAPTIPGNNEALVGLVVALRKPREWLVALLDGGADIDAINEAGRTALHEACLLGMADEVGFLLERSAAVEVADANGLHPLHIACNRGNVEVARLLLQAGADVNALGGWRTPLKWAMHPVEAARKRGCDVGRNEQSLLALLCDAGADRSLLTPSENGILDQHVPCISVVPC